MGDWSQLPSDLSDLITLRLSILDLIRFSCVCASWRSVSAPVLRRKNFLPWLIFAYKEKQHTSPTLQNDQTFGFFSLSDSKVYPISLPDIAGRRICGSFAGWVITVDEDLEVQLLQPFSRTIVPLPSLMKLPGKQRIGTHLLAEDRFLYDTFRADYIQEWESRCLRDYYIEKVIMSSLDSPVVMAIFRNSKKLAYCRLGKDDKWNIMEHNSLYMCRDITYYKGQFYAINHSREVFVIGGLDTNPPLRPVVEIISAPQEDYGSNDAYLVESGGALLMVIRFVHYNANLDVHVEEFVPHKTLRFKVLKIDYISGSKGLVEVDSLGDQALFVGYNNSFSLSTSKFRDLKGNCIYFTTGSSERYSGDSCGGHEIGVFDLENGNIEPCYHSGSQLTWFLANPR